MVDLIVNRKAMRITNPAEVDAPEFSADAGEKLAIKRFLDFALADLKFQFAAMQNEPGMDRKTIHNAQQDAVFLSNYVKRLREGVDHMALSAN